MFSCWLTWFKNLISSSVLLFNTMPPNVLNILTKSEGYIGRRNLFKVAGVQE